MPNMPTIFISKDANEIEKFSAKELSAYLSDMTDKRIGIVDKPSGKCIYVGCFPDALKAEAQARLLNELEELHDDGFVIKSLDDNIVIKGKTPRGTLYGVYDYLYRLGARWYFPGKEHEFIPKCNDVFLDGIDIKETPDFDHRSICIHFWEKEFEDWVDFAAKTKLNAIHLHSDEGLADMAKLTANRGLDYNFRRHFFGDKYSPEDKSYLENSRNLIKNYIGNLPEYIKDFFLWPADVVLQLLDNPEEWSIADTVLMFTNEMAKAVKDVRPDGRMSFLSYWTTWGVPKKVKPVDNVFLEIAHMHQCYSHSIADQSCRTNWEEVASIIEGLLDIFDPSETHILGYWLDASLFGRGVYKDLSGRLPYIGKNIQQDFQYYKSKGIHNISTFAVGLNRDYFSRFISPTVFQYSALLWDTEYDLDSEIALFCENYFGEGEIADIFKHTENIDPKHKDTECWDELRKHLSDSESKLIDVINATKNDLYVTRLNRLLEEIKYVSKWFESE